MMSDIDRNVGFGAAMTQAETAAIEGGNAARLLKIDYNAAANTEMRRRL